MTEIFGEPSRTARHCENLSLVRQFDVYRRGRRDRKLRGSCRNRFGNAVDGEAETNQPEENHQIHIERPKEYPEKDQLGEKGREDKGVDITQRGVTVFP